MRYRSLDSNQDYAFGFGQANFLIDSPEAVGQAVLTRLRLDFGAWFLDTTDGTNWKTGVLGPNTINTRDAIIQARILGTAGVQSILYYSSSVDSNTRNFYVAVSIDTIYGVYPTPPPLLSPSITEGTVGRGGSGVISSAPGKGSGASPITTPSVMRFVLGDISAGHISLNILG